MKTDIVLPSKEVYAKFESFFGTDLADYKDVLMMIMTRRFSFDIFRFNEYCRWAFGYDVRKHGSLHEFIKTKFGEEASQLLVDLLRF